MRRQKACDRCYRYKEQCDSGNHNLEGCSRCRDRGLVCTTSRALVRLGRRPKANRLGPNGSVQIFELEEKSNDFKLSRRRVCNHSSPCATTISVNSLSEDETRLPLPSLLTWQRADADELLHSSPHLVGKFYAHYDIFMVGSSFACAFRTSIQETYVCAPVLVQEIYSAMSAAIQRARYCVFLSETLDVEQGASSVQKLRTAQIHSLSDALAIVSLGQTLAAFDFLTNCDSPWLILRYSLSSAQPWYEELSANPAYDPITICPIFWDTLWCLLRREIPVVRFRPRATPVVDRLAGICTTLLPIFYDLCVAGNKLKRQSNGAPPEVHASCIGRIERIEEKLHLWTPKTPHNFNVTFSKQEILGMRTQAQMYRTSALLIVHRMLNPFGTGDDTAISLANSILHDFLQYQEMTGSAASLHNTAFPVLLASLEISDMPTVIWNSIAMFNLAPVCLAKMQALVESVWTTRLNGSRDYLFDLVDAGPDFVVVP